MEGKVWIGVLTATGLSYDNMVKVALFYEKQYLQVRIVYVTGDMIDVLGVISAFKQKRFFCTLIKFKKQLVVRHLCIYRYLRLK